MTADLHLEHLDALTLAYQKVLERHDYAGVLIYSGHPRMQFGDDQTASFSAFGHFLHWAPLPRTEHAWLLIRPGHRPVLHWYAPQDFWYLSPTLPDASWVEHFDIQMQSNPAPPRLPTHERFAILGDVDAAMAQGIGAELNPEPLWLALDELRVRKSRYEIACLREANRMAHAGHLAAHDAFDAEASELDVQLAYLGASRQRESEVPYQNIVGMNCHAGVLHYQLYETQPPRHPHSLLVDAGYRHQGYCADITRTWAGRESIGLFSALIDSVTKLQQELIAALSPGLAYPSLHAAMHQGLGTLLAEHGIVRCSAEAAVAQGITYAFCPHGLGHLLGLQVHDVGGRRDGDGTLLPPPENAPALRLTRTLEPGMVVTMEPGCYIIPMLLAPLRTGEMRQDIDWQSVDALAPHGGIRVEDNVAITADGHDNLTPQS